MKSEKEIKDRIEEFIKLHEQYKKDFIIGLIDNKKYHELWTYCFENIKSLKWVLGETMDYEILR